MALDRDQLPAQRSPSKYGWTFTFTFMTYELSLVKKTQKETKPKPTGP